MAKELLQLYSLFLEIDLLRTLYIDGVIENINMILFGFFINTFLLIFVLLVDLANRVLLSKTELTMIKHIFKYT